MRKLFETIMINTGGRMGESNAPDKSFVVKIADPKAGVQGATNPEQLFAAGYSACFSSALAMVLKNEGVKGETTVSAKVALYGDGPGVFQLGAEIEGHVEGLDLEKTQELLDKAHQVCPYSKAIKGNVEVTVKAV